MRPNARTGRVSEPDPDARHWSRERMLAYLYDWEHDAFEADLDLYVALARRTGGPVLELACGTGRVLQALARYGVAATGLDRSGAMLERARERLAGLRPKPRLVQTDLRDPLPSGPFALVILGLDTLGLVCDLEGHGDLLRRVHSSLGPGGLVVLDLVHIAALADQPEGIPVLQVAGESPRLGAHVTKWMVRRVHPADETIELHSFYDVVWSEGSVARLVDSLSLRYFARYEIEILLAAAGFAIEGIYGDYELGPFRDESERMVIVAAAPVSPKT
jgi:SAM-dependent methyltransferase